MTKIIQWALFGVAIGLIPLIVEALKLATQHLPVTLAALTGKGELILIAAGLAAAGIGDLFLAGPKLLKLKLICGGFCALISAVGSMYYSSLSSLGHADPSMVAKISIWTFVMTIISAGSCAALSEVK